MFLILFFIQKLRIDVAILIPHIKAKGKYDVNGQVLLLPIMSHGDFYAEFCENIIAKNSNKFLSFFVRQFSL
jgi:hypothetical protein